MRQNNSFSVMNETMFNVSLPDIAAYFDIAPSAANWTNTCFSLSFAIGIAVYGKISEHTGMRKLLSRRGITHLHWSWLSPSRVFSSTLCLL